MIYFRPMRIFTRAVRVVTAQRDLIETKDKEIAVLRQIILVHQRSLLELAIGFRVALEQPEVDIRDELDAMIQELSYGIAQTEEYVV